MNRLAVLNVVGLSPSLISSQNTPHIHSFLSNRKGVTLLEPFPAVTCTSQATLLTGQDPSIHGVVGNGWYFRDLAEVAFWKQSNYLVQAPKVWDELCQKNPDFRVAKLFWWYNMYSTAHYTITPRPHYPSDGSKVFDIYTQPASLSQEIEKIAGKFPFASFWGPAAGISCSKWIARAAQEVEKKYQPHLSLVYIPHLDYPLQKLGPNHAHIPQELKALDEVIGNLLNFYSRKSVEVLLLSEYGITSVSRALHPNRILREAGLLKTRPSLTWELPDFGASEALAVSDHQISHVYIKNPEDISRVKSLFENVPGIKTVLAGEEKKAWGLDHPRAGDLVLMAEPNTWFTYYFWLDDKKAPDFARCVDIHRKPGYDPLELFLDPQIIAPRLKIAWYLLKKKLGFRYRIPVIPLNAELVKGSHGTPAPSSATRPVCIGRSEWFEKITTQSPIQQSSSNLQEGQWYYELPMKSVYNLIKNFYQE